MQKESLLDGDYSDRLMEVKVQHERLGEGKLGPRFTRRASLDTDRVNISEELSKTAMWTQLRNSPKPPIHDQHR